MGRARTFLGILVAVGAAVLAPAALGDAQGLGNAITVEKEGNGSGTVTSSPAGINCGTVCSAVFPAGLLVKLTATPAPGSTFTGWNGGGCTGIGACTVGTTVSGVIVATFSASGYRLTVDVYGNGRVSSSPAGIECPTTCGFPFVSGAQVRLSANPSAGASFLSWGGACSGTGACVVAMSRAQAVTANFSVTSVRATVLSTRFTRGGGAGTQRVLRVRIRSEQDLARVVVRVRRRGVTIASQAVSDLDAGTSVVRVPVRNAVVSGPAQARVTFTSEPGAQETEAREIQIPPLV